MAIPIAVGPVRDPRSRRLLLAGGVLLIVLGASVIAGWTTGQDGLVRVLHGATPMPFNTALAFIVAGVALLAIRHGRMRLALTASLVVAGFGLLSLLQHTADLLPQLDTLFFMPSGPLADVASTRASPNLALTIFLAGAGLLAVSLRSHAVARFGAAQLGAAAASIALVDVLAFLSVTNGHGLSWVVPQMAIHSATGIALLGTVLTTTAWRASGDEEERRQNRVPLMIGLLVTVAAIMLAQVLRANDRQRVRDAVQAAAQTLADRVQREMHLRMASLDGLAGIWAGLGDEARSGAAGTALQSLPGPGALGWISRGDSRKWVSFAGPTEGVVDTTSWPAPSALDSLRVATPMLLHTATGSGPTFGVAAPVASVRSSDGFLWLVTAVGPWLETSLRGVSPQYDVTVQDGERQLYERVTAQGSGARVWAQAAEASARSLRWQVRAWPTPATLASVRSALPIVVLTAGTLLGVLLGLSASLLRAADIRAGQLTAAHERLSAEMHERVAAQEALRHSEDQLRQAQRLEAVGRLSGGIAHDFENILTTIRSNSRTLLHQGSFSGLARDALEHIDRAASRGSLLTTRLLSFSQRQVLQPESVRLGELVEGLRGELEPLLGPAVHVSIERRPGEDAVFVDRQWMTQVVLDLVFDARESMPLGGTLTIRTMPADEPIRGFYGVVSRPHLGAVLEIEHSGRDMAQAVQGRLFEPFFSATQASRSSGLALSSAHGIVKQSGGEIVTRGTAGGGTRIGIFLPVLSMPAPPTMTLRFDGVNVVLVDSDQDLLGFATRVLSDAGCAVIAGPTAEDALEKLRAQGLRPDLLVSAIILPGMSGVELAARLREEFPSVAVLFVSGYTSEATQQVGIEALNAALLQKPFVADELVRRMALVLDRST